MAAPLPEGQYTIASEVNLPSPCFDVPSQHVADHTGDIQHVLQRFGFQKWELNWTRRGPINASELGDNFSTSRTTMRRMAASSNSTSPETVHFSAGYLPICAEEFSLSKTTGAAL
jgi:hypothetical protein